MNYNRAYFNNNSCSISTPHNSSKKEKKKIQPPKSITFITPEEKLVDSEFGRYFENYPSPRPRCHTRFNYLKRPIEIFKLDTCRVADARKTFTSFQYSPSRGV